MSVVRHSARALMAASLVLAGCAERVAGPRAPAELTALPRALSAAEEAVSAASNRFAFDLLREVRADANGANVFLSPLSVSMALGMTANGAAGSTLEGIHEALRVSGVPEAEVDAAYRDLIALLRGLDPAVDFRLASSVWLDEGHPFRSAFSDVVREYFDATTTTLDLQVPATLGRVNGWASEHTAGKIDRVLEEMPAGAVALLMNAVYFKGSWRSRFDAAQTREAPFHSAGGPTTARLMAQTGWFRHVAHGDVQAVELPYGNGAFVMTVLLPSEARSLDALVAALDDADWRALLAAMRETEVELALPRLKLKEHYLLNDALARMGMGAALAPGADFSRLTSADVYVSHVLHDTYVDVHEEGTEAAAVTTAVIRETSLPQRVTMRVDRPYLFAIRERFSGTILFVGAVSQP